MNNPEKLLFFLAYTYVGTLNPSFQLSRKATGTSLRPIADMFLEHMLDPKPFENIRL